MSNFKADNYCTKDADCYDFMGDVLGIGQNLLELGRSIDRKCADEYEKIARIKGYNQIKVLNAFRDKRVAPMHFAPSYGYGYSDPGREKLEELFACLFGTEKALVRPQIASGTHALGLALFGLLRRGDSLVSVSGTPYDTLCDIIGAQGYTEGSLTDIGVEYSQVELKDGMPDIEGVRIAAKKHPTLMMLQRSRGYADRPSISIEKMREVFNVIKEESPDTLIMVDNCYGEFVDVLEPTQVGADIAVGSLIKNIGGGIAPTGGYIAGSAENIDKIACRLTTPGIGGEVGSYAAGYLPFFQGLYLAPGAVAQALTGAVFAAAALKECGYKVSPERDEKRSCIIQTVHFGCADELIAFIRSIQAFSPVESNVVPEPWDMPGYRDQVIMAAGTFVQGASIELSADAPIRSPYIAFMQGGLACEQVKAAVLNYLQQTGH